MFKITKQPDLTLKIPSSPSFWRSVALAARRWMRKRTIEDAVDVAGRAFKKYSDAYREYRKKKGRGVVPNLSFTGRMLGAMQAIGKRLKGQILLSGQEGLKAFGNEARGRKFFDLSTKDRNSVIKLVARWMTKKNRLKPGRKLG